MGILNNFIKKIVFKQTLKNVRGLCKSLSKAYKTAQKVHPNNSSVENLKIALNMRPGWHRINDNTFSYKKQELSISDNATLPKIVKLVSEYELRNNGKSIPLDELTTLQLMADEAIDDFFNS